MKRNEIISWDEKIEYLEGTVLGLEEIMFNLLDKIPEVKHEIDRLYDEAVEYNNED